MDQYKPKDRPYAKLNRPAFGRSMGAILWTTNLFSPFLSHQWLLRRRKHMLHQTAH